MGVTGSPCSQTLSPEAFMAPNSTPRRRFGAALGVVTTGIAAGLIGFSGIAGAHTPNVTAECAGDTTTLTVKFTQYRDEHNNHVKITDGDSVLVEKDFKAKYEKSFTAPGDVNHVFRVVVTAWDDEKYNYDQRFEVPACFQPTSTTEETTTEETTTSTTTEESTPSSTTESSEAPTTSSEAPPVSTTTVAPTTTPTAVDDEALAETGASIGVPLGIAGVLLVGGAVALIIVRRRGKA
jgi:cobalamin biosynthesis Mg chelatase CobN